MRPLACVLHDLWGPLRRSDTSSYIGRSIIHPASTNGFPPVLYVLVAVHVCLRMLDGLSNSMSCCSGVRTRDEAIMYAYTWLWDAAANGSITGVPRMGRGCVCFCASMLACYD